MNDEYTSDRTGLTAIVAKGLENSTGCFRINPCIPQHNSHLFLVGYWHDIVYSRMTLSDIARCEL